MALPKFEQKINDIVGDAISRSNPVLTGVVVGSYYREPAESGQVTSTGEILLDVIVTDGAGDAVERFQGVPYQRSWGVQPTLPPVGSKAIMITSGDKKSGTFCIAVFETRATDNQLLDTEKPNTLPKVMLR